MQCWHWRFFLSMTRVSFYMGKVLAQDVFGFAGKRLFFDVFDACLPKSCETNSNETNNHMMCSLVGGFKHFLFSIIYGIILPIDSYFSRWLKPPTRFMLFSLCFPFFFHRFTNQSYGSSQSKASWDGCCWWTTRNLEGHYCFATEIASYLWLSVFSFSWPNTTFENWLNLLLSFAKSFQSSIKLSALGFGNPKWGHQKSSCWLFESQFLDKPTSGCWWLWSHCVL